MTSFERAAPAADGLPGTDSGPTSPSHRPEGERKPVLIILHQEHSTPGHVGRLLIEKGHALDVRRPRYGDPLPATLSQHAGAVIFGGPMSANDPDDFVRREIALVEMAILEQAPYLGLCLGAQMMAAALGARVAPDPDGQVELGYHTVAPVRDIAQDWPTTVYQWHSEGFALPSGGELLVTAEGAFPNQAFRYGPAAFALQFHPEITHAMISRWSARNEGRLGRPGAQARPDQLATHVWQGPRVRTWLDRFLDTWLASAR